MTHQASPDKPRFVQLPSQSAACVHVYVPMVHGRYGDSWPSQPDGSEKGKYKSAWSVCVVIYGQGALIHNDDDGGSLWL